MMGSLSPTQKLIADFFYKPAGSIIDRVDNRLSSGQRHLSWKKGEHKWIQDLQKKQEEKHFDLCDLKLDTAH